MYCIWVLNFKEHIPSNYKKIVKNFKHKFSYDTLISLSGIFKPDQLCSL